VRDRGRGSPHQQHGRKLPEQQADDLRADGENERVDQRPFQDFTLCHVEKVAEADK
jgi:hypothetical protein